ncbi:dihydrolipoamide acetyltransferase family protein [Mucilaginibacter ginkgonis]|uniref:Dihydrolipoamide acetyltransferase component of pyruvate dehydrogenase complex n=1 Tax=Mucilaginibacter ginkgonis TaxID=2682091 RepID=A0A6I4IN54_9SPHI|nr:dihydrolipoamide acetyltransferase family protein [Mucilaginibacter ginkgonis]QQL51171.1 2-oxo acid dehydrogenase subunit E2 [Mucilaginibacter ginkgonis]
MSDYQLLLPKMGESVAEATVIRWLKNPGDTIEADEAVLEIATDKVDSEVPSPVAGVLSQQLYKVDDVVQVGSPLAVIQTGAAQSTAPAAQPAHVAAPTVQEQSAPASQPIVSSPAPAPQAEPVKSAQIPGIDQLQNKAAAKADSNGGSKSGRFYSPLVKSIASREGIDINDLANIPGTGSEGRLTKDDLLNYLQSKKVAPQQQVSETPQSAPQASAPAAVRSQQESAPAPQPESVQQTQAPAAEPNAAQQPVRSQPQVSQPQTYQQQPAYQQQPPPYVFYPQIIMPGAYPQNEAAQQPSSAPKADDVPQKKAVSVGGEDEIIEMNRMRRLIADHMVDSKHSAPHVTSFIEVDVTNLVAWREKAKKVFEQREDSKLTFTPIFVEAVTYAIRALPMINVSVDGYNIIKRKNINIGMATALPSGNLIVPVIKKADELSLVGLAKAVNDLADRARKNKLKPEEIQDGTFTITNVGTFGNLMGTPIINQPQVAILAIGAIKKKPAVVETPSGDVIAIRHMMFLSLSYDHRVVDGSLGGAFIKKVSDYLESWDINKQI